MIYLIILALVLSGCYSPHQVSITNKLSMYLSEGDKWDLFTLLEQSFKDEIESVTLDTVHHPFDTLVAIIHFAPKQIDTHTFEFKTCFVFHEDWGWGRILDVKIRKGKWYSDLHVRTIIKHRYILKSHTILIPEVKNATYQEIQEILRKIENGEYLITEPGYDDTRIDINLNSVTWIEKDYENSNVSYTIRIRTGKYRGYIFVFAYRDGKLCLIRSGMWIS